MRENIIPSIVLIFLFFTGSQTFEQDKVHDVPGYFGPPLNFDMYSGYLNASKDGDELFHYVLATSQRSRVDDPLVLWVCGMWHHRDTSSHGLLTDIGPFEADHERQGVKEKKWSWNRVANILYLETPAATGYSYSKTWNNFTNGFSRSTQLNYQALQHFLLKFPEFRGREFFIAGQNYGTDYTLLLSHRIIQFRSTEQELPLTLKGVLIVSPGSLPRSKFDGQFSLQFLFAQGLYPVDLYLKKMCEDELYAGAKICAETHYAFPDPRPPIPKFYNLNTRQSCVPKQGETSDANDNQDRPRQPLNERYCRTPWELMTDLYPLEVNWIARKDVRKALNIPDEAPEWVLYDENRWSRVKYGKREYMDVVLHLKEAMNNKVRVLMMGGDSDGLNIWMNTDHFIRSQGWAASSYYEPFTLPDGTWGGMWQSVGRYLQLALVRNSGHFIQTDQPASAFFIFQSFLTKYPMSRTFPTFNIWFERRFNFSDY